MSKTDRWNEDSWQKLKNFTSARVAIGKAGYSLPTKATLQFRLDHAMAKDAVKQEIDFDTIAVQLTLPTLLLKSKVENKTQYLQRPDLGKQLNEDSKKSISSIEGKFDLSIIIADGLSAPAVQNHAVHLLNVLLPYLNSYQIAPIALVRYGRVAIGDPIAAGLKAQMSVVFIGERPGLSAADSLGVYTTFKPQSGKTDESRNCVSNIRTGGLSYEEAAHKIAYLIKESFRLQLSGIQLKENAGNQLLNS